MAVSQAEYAAFTAELASSAVAVGASIAKMEDFANKATAEALEAKTVMIELQASYNTLAAQAAPATDLKALFEATKAEVEELRRRALEVERRST